MLLHPDTVLALAKERHRDLIEEADRYRLLKLALRLKRESDRRDIEVEAENRIHHAGTLAGCGPHAAAPAR